MFFQKNKSSPDTKVSLNSMTNPLSLKRKTSPSIIATDMNVLGNVVSEGLVDVDGRVEGNVRAAQVTVRGNGNVTGDVVAETVQIYGAVKGIIKARHVELFSSCRVEGIIMHESLMIEDGAYVDGKFKRTDKIDLEDSAMKMLTSGFAESTGEAKEPAMNMFENIRLING